MKLKNKKKLQYYLRQLQEDKMFSDDCAKALGITRRRFNQVFQEYLKKNKEVPEIGKNVGRPQKVLTEAERKRIETFHKKYKFGALYLEKVMVVKGKPKINRNKIHEYLIQKGLAESNPKKQRRRKPYIRYERKRPLSMGHMDWHSSRTIDAAEVCVTLDDSSRKILSGNEFTHATTENTTRTLNNTYEKYKHIRPIREALTDNGSQFCAVRKRSKGNSKHRFGDYCLEKNIKHIKTGVKKPETNGKNEYWFYTYERFRKDFTNFRKLIDWYNNRPHGSLDFKSPNEVFWERLQPYVLQMAFKLFRW